MKVPTASRAGFHEVEELVVTGFNQPLAKIEAMAPDEQFLAPKGMTDTTVAGIRCQVVVIEHVPHRLIPRKSDGAEVGQKCGRQGRKVGHRAGICRAVAETMVQKLVSNILVQEPDFERRSGARTSAEPPGVPEGDAAGACRSGDYGPGHLA